MPTIKLYKGPKTSTNVVNYQCATFDFENATADLDYVIDNQATGTLPTTGEELKQIRLHITLAGINFLSDYAESSTSEQNLVLPPVYDVGEGTSANPFDISEAKLVPIGEKPSDWELRYMDKYFTRNILSNSGVYYANYPSAGTARSGVYYPTWDKNTQYYEVPNFAQIFYTDATGFFGISRSLVPTASGVQETVRALYNRRPYGSNNFYPSEFWWKANGAFGTQLFSQSLATSQKVMINMSSSQANPMNTYQSRLLVQMIRFDYEEETYTGIAVITLSADGLPQEAQITALSAPFWKEEITPAKGGETSHVKGGNGTFSAPSNNRGDENGDYVQSITNIWEMGVETLMGNYNKYVFSVGDIAILEDAMQEIFNPDLYDGVKSLIAKPLDGIVQIHSMPARISPPKDGSSKPVYSGFLRLTENGAPTFTKCYTTTHIGSVNILDYFDGYPDLNNTTVQIHLPYIGNFNLDTSAVMMGTIAVDYVTDVVSGDCTAWVWCKDYNGNHTYRYLWKGNCAKAVHLQQAPYNPVIGLTAKAAPLVIGAVAGTAAGAIAGIGAIARNASTAVSNMADFSSVYGSFSPAAMLSSMRSDHWLGDGMTSVGATAATGATNFGMSVMTSLKGMPSLGSGSITSSNADTTGTTTTPIDTQCYLIITRPQWSNPERYGEMFGYPSDIGGTISGTGFKDFLSCRAIKLNGLTATDTERTEIANLMASGVYV